MGLLLTAYCFQSSCLLWCTYSNDMVINKLMEVFFKQTSFGHTVFSVIYHTSSRKRITQSISSDKTLASVWLPAEALLIPRRAQSASGRGTQNRSRAAGAELAAVGHTLPCRRGGGLAFQEEGLAMPTNRGPSAASQPGKGLTAGTCPVHQQETATLRATSLFLLPSQAMKIVF